MYSEEVALSLITAVSDLWGIGWLLVCSADDHVELLGKTYKDWLKDTEKSVADLKKRVSKPKNQVIELEGSFKTLEID